MATPKLPPVSVSRLSPAAGQRGCSWPAPAELSASHAYFYRFELSPSGQPSPLTFLPFVPGSQPTALTAPPGGGSYAYSTAHCDTAPPNGEIGISGRTGNRTWAYDEADDYAFSLAPAPMAARSPSRWPLRSTTCC